jgi:hypothetical protein
MHADLITYVTALSSVPLTHISYLIYYLGYLR